MKLTKSMIADAEKTGGTVVRKMRPGKPDPGEKVVFTPKPPEKDELQPLRDEISKLKADIEQIKSAGDKRAQELSAMLKAATAEKPFRVKPVRDMDPQSKTYLLVTHYDFVPVTYRKLDS